VAKKLLQYFCSIIAVIGFVIFFPAIAQETKDNMLEQKIETIAEDMEDSDIDYTIIFDELLYFLENPINLNRTNKNELQSLHLLSDIQINHLLEHIEKNGKLIAIYELQAIRGFDMTTIKKILPYVTIHSDLDRPRITFKELFANGQHQVITRHQRVLEQQAGYAPMDDSTLAAKPNSRYLGSPDRIFVRYRFNYGNKVSWGFTAEKDPGEQFFRGSQKQGFDYFSAHLFMRNVGVVKALAIGDYQLQLGQGLTFWSGFAFRKSSFITNIKRQGMGLRAYGAVDENRFLRGAGVTLGHKGFEFTAFGSHKKIDANVITVSDTLELEDDFIVNEQTIITSLQLTGLHRTPTEIARRNTISETIYGGNLAYHRRNFHIGVTAVRTEFGGILSRNLSFYNQFEFNSQENTNIGLDYNYIWRNMNFFGEFSRSANGGLAAVNGVLMSLDQRVSFVVLHRNFQRNYQGIYTAAFGEGARNANEQGIYTGIIVQPVPKVSLNMYYDRYIFPWMRFQIDAPSYGSDMFAQVNYMPSKKTELYFRIRQRDRFRNTTEDIDEIDYIVGTWQINYRFNAAYQITPTIRLRNRIETINFRIGEGEDEKGFLIYQDVIYRGLTSPWQFTARYALFDTDSWNSRLYAYETDVLYAFSIPAFYMRGSRAYLMVKYTFKRNFDIWFRISQTFMDNRNTIGSGLDLIEGNTRTETKIQLRYRF
jgi:hypothetical protein